MMQHMAEQHVCSGCGTLHDGDHPPDWLINPDTGDPMTQADLFTGLTEIATQREELDEAEALIVNYLRTGRTTPTPWKAIAQRLKVNQTTLIRRYGPESNPA